MAQRKPRPVPQHLISTPPRASLCVACKAEILTCMVHGEPTGLDPVHLNLKGEAVAIVSGAHTYEASPHGGGHPFRRRCSHIDEGLPVHGYIHPAHRCGVTWQPDMIDGRRLFDVPYLGTTPPF